MKWVGDTRKSWSNKLRKGLQNETVADICSGTIHGMLYIFTGFKAVMQGQQVVADFDSDF